MRILRSAREFHQHAMPITDLREFESFEVGVYWQAFWVALLRNFSTGLMRFCIPSLLLFGYYGVDCVQAEIQESEQTEKKLDVDPEFFEKHSQWDVYYLDLETGVERQLTKSSVEESKPVLSDNGTTLAFIENGVLKALDLEAGKMRYEADSGLVYHDIDWVPEKLLISAIHTRLVASEGQNSTTEESQIVIVDPTIGTVTYLTDSKSVNVISHSWSTTGNYVALLGQSDVGDTMALSVFDGFTNQDLKAIHTFEKNSRPLTVFWLPGDSSIGVLVSLKGQGNAVFEIDVHSGIARELYRARVVESIFDVSPRTGRLAVSKEYFPLESAPTDHPDLEPALKVDGVDIKWCAYDKGVLYKSRRWRATDLDKWEKGLTIESDSCYVILEGGGITAFEDTDHQYPPFVREIKVHHDGKTEAKWISLTPEEIKALGALAKDRRYIEGEIPNGESGDRK